MCCRFHFCVHALNVCCALVLCVQAWAIPVGGRTRRSEQLRAILTNLLTHGVNPSDVFVFEV